MSDDTTRTDGWSASETTGNAPEGTAQNDAPRVGFCQDCGRPLTQETLRTVGTGVFCEPCLTARVGATAPTSGYTTIPPYSAVSPQAATTSDPSPVLAGILGFIPGVGAMYNGQFAKGIVHLAIFVLLTFLANNVSGLCWIFCWGWIFYMAFEAYHTAVARRDGLPLPNAFGFNDMGERMGFGKSWSAAGTARPAGSGAPQNPPNQAPIVDTAGAYAPVPVPVGTAPNWVGYVPPTAFAVPSSPSPSQGEPFAASQSSAAWGHAPYVETYTGASQPYGAAVPPTAPPIQEPAARRFPTSAFWLIGLGVLILIANLLPDWKLTEQWWAPVFFAGLSVWLLMRRLRSGAKLVCIIRWPVVLMVLAVMLALHAAYFPVTFGLAFSVLLIVFGGLLFLERTAGAGPAYAPPVVAPYSGTATVVDTQAEEARARTTWGTSSSNETNIDPDATKGGQ